jgi:hypothetical protein
MISAAETTSSETVREFWHGTPVLGGLINEYTHAA